MKRPSKHRKHRASHHGMRSAEWAVAYAAAYRSMQVNYALRRWGFFSDVHWETKDP